MDKIKKSDKDWKEELGPEIYRVTRTCGTEPPFSGKWLNHKGKGQYTCSNCGMELFSSDSKFDSGTGWPSFDEVISQGNVETREDTSAGMTRMEDYCHGANPNGYRRHMVFTICVWKKMVGA